MRVTEPDRVPPKIPADEMPADELSADKPAADESPADFDTAASWTFGRVRVCVAAGLLLTLGLTATGYRIVTDYQTPGPFDPTSQGLCDFHNGIYFPARAVLAGESPYSDAYAAKYPVARQIPFFSPIILVLHAPLAWLPLRMAEVLHIGLQLVLLAVMACWIARAAGMPRRIDVILSVASAIVLSRGGHITLFNGYFTFQIVLATFLSVYWADKKPLHAALALFVVSAKPTYILPLGFLMLARGNLRALAVGAVFSITGAAASLGWIAFHEGGGDLAAGVRILRDQIIDTQAVHRSMEDESPVFSWTRLDLFAIIAKWRGEDPGDLPHLLAMFAFLVAPMAVLWRRRQSGLDDGIGGLTGAVVMTGMLVSLYHQSYDSLLLAAPVAGLVVGRLPAWRSRHRVTRAVLVGLLSLPAVNYVSTRFFLSRLDLSESVVKVVTSVNGLSLAIGLVLLCVIASRPAKS